MARTPLVRLLRQLARLCAADKGEALPPPSHDTLTRREFLAMTGATAGILALERALGRQPAQAGLPSPRVAIVGGGLAGLMTALPLAERAVGCRLYEASGRIGGRVESDRASWLNGQVTEPCGELIDTGHTTMRPHARRFGLRLGARLASIARATGGSIRLGFASGPGEVVADQVVLAPPFAVLRTLDLDGAAFPARKRTAIDELGSGVNATLAVQFTRWLWRERGPWGRSKGSPYADTGYQSTWEASRGQNGATGIVVNYTGGSVGAGPPAGVEAGATRFLAQLEPVWPGITAAWTGRATLAAPIIEPLRQGSYPSYRVGQMTRSGGVAGERSGNIHFAGDHCSTDSQGGYMEGAVREGQRAALEVVADLVHAPRTRRALA